jgi:hypothetical protein
MRRRRTTEEIRESKRRLAEEVEAELEHIKAMLGPMDEERMRDIAQKYERRVRDIEAELERKRILKRTKAS